MCDHCGCRSYPQIAELTDDHDRILELAWRIAEAHRACVDVGADHDALTALLDAHVSREEKGLYPLLADGGDLTADVRDALEEEHRDLDAAIATGGFDRRAYYALAAHIEHEETELFPAAMFAFDEEEWHALRAVHHAHPAPVLEPR